MDSGAQQMPERSSVLVVCLGNICRSPAGEMLLANLAKEMGLKDVKVASCGTGDWNLGYPPDPRMVEAAKRRGFELKGTARGIQDSDFARFDYILAVDREILQVLRLRAPDPTALKKIHLLGDFSARYPGLSIPDPYYGESKDFELVLDMLEDACLGFLQHIRQD